MNRFFLKEDTGLFSKENTHHIINVMRMRSGEKAIVCYDGVCHTANIIIENKIARYEKISQIENEPKPNISLLQGLMKKDKQEFVIKYATLFGVKEIIFSPFKRTIKKDFEFNKFKERFYKIAEDASETSHRNNIPNITYYDNLKEIPFKDYKKIILFYENETNFNIEESLKDISINDDILIIIGPEGGIDEAEVKFFKDLGADILSLGKNIYTAESASLPALSIINYLILNNNK